MLKVARLLLISLTVLALGSSAQQPGAPEPPELVAARAEHLRAMAQASIQPLNNYLRTLQATQRLLVSQRKDTAPVNAEIAKITEELTAANRASDLSKAAPAQFQLDSAMYGDPKTKRMVDVTAAVRAALDSDTAATTVNAPGLDARDPAPGTDKFLIVT